MDELASAQPKATSAIVEFVYGPISEHPYQVGKALKGRLAGLHSARRGDFRIVYRIGVDTIVIEAVGHRSSIYRPR